MTSSNYSNYDYLSQSINNQNALYKTAVKAHIDTNSTLEEYTTTIAGAGTYVSSNWNPLPNAMGGKQITIKETEDCWLYLFIGHQVGDECFGRLDKNTLTLQTVNKERAKAIINGKEQEYLAMIKLKK